MVRNKVVRGFSTTFLCIAFFAFALLAVLAFAGSMPAYAAQAGGQSLGAATLSAQDASDELEYEVGIKGFPYASEQGIFGVPGEKMTLKATTTARDADWNTTAVKGVTYKWSAKAKLKAKAKGSKLVVKSLPKAGKYTVKATAYSKDGDKLGAIKFKVVVKKKPSVKVVMRVKGSKGGFTKTSSTVKADSMMMLDMKNAYFGWDNNTKKKFYTWAVKDLQTGKTAKWNAKSGSFKKNAFISGGSVAGGGSPVFMGSFTKAGKYRVIATMYHSNKKMATAKKTITVK